MVTPANEAAGIFITETRDNSEPVHYALQVNSFSELVKNNINKYVSNEFEAGGYKWKMILYPKGDNNTANDHISLHVALSDDKVGRGIYATVRFSVFDQVNETYFTKQGKAVMFHKLKLQLGFSKFMPLQIFNDPSKGYLVNDNCMFGVGILVLKSCGIGESLSLKNEASLPCVHKWELTHLSSMREKMKLEAFTVGNYKWYVLLYPSGDSSCNEYLSLFIYLDNTNLAQGQKVCATVTLRLKGPYGVVLQEHQGTCNWYSSKNPCFGWSKFISSNVLQEKRIMLYCCSIEAEVIVVGEVTTLK